MPNFAAPDYVTLRMAPNESQMQLINMQEPETPSGSPCFDTPSQPRTNAYETSQIPRISYLSGKGSVRWWKSRTTLEKLLLIAILLLLCIIAAFIAVTVRLSNSASSGTSEIDGSSVDATTTSKPVPTPAEGVCSTQGCVHAANYLMNAINESADPCDNFFEYACGQWNYAHPIPDDNAVFGTFTSVREIVRQQSRVLLEMDVDSPSKSINMARASYRICMNVTELDAVKSSPLLKYLESIGGWPVMSETVDGSKIKPWSDDSFDLTDMLAKTREYYGGETFISIFVYADSKNTTKNALFLDQGLLTLGRGARDYYLNATMFGTHIAAFTKYIYEVIGILMKDAGLQPSEEVNKTVKDIVDFETQLAKITTPEDERRNSTRQYNKKTFKDLYELLPQIDWMRYFTRITPTSVHDLFSNDTEIIVAEVEYMTKLSELLNQTSPRLLADYVLWRVVASSTKFLDDRYEEVRHELQKIMTGQQMRSPRWKDCATVPSSLLPLAAGAIYVERHFDSDDKKEAMEMIQNLRRAFSEIVMESDWMDGETKAIAIEKAKAMIELIGYPDFISDPKKLDKQYEGLDITSHDSYFDMMQKVVIWNQNKEFNKLKKPFDKMEFDISPAVVNAFYSPERNSITFPAGILQPPFFRGGFPKAINYGAIGAVIGHEITHGFDDQGSQYDKAGNLINWWNDISAKGFEKRKECIVSQYSSYSVPDTELKVNGKLTLGENIADNGGVKEAYRAYRAHVNEFGEEPRLPGLQHLSNDQIFFLSYANFWCGHKTKAAAVQQVLTDEHSPELFRVIGVLSNFPEFAKAFSCKAGTVLNPVNKCSVW